jgi:hypothetical protein
MAAAQPLDGGEGARVEAAGEQDEPRRVTGHDGFKGLGDLGKTAGVPARDLGRGAERAGDLPLDRVARDVQHDGAAVGLVEREQVGAGHRLPGHELDVGHAQLGREGLPG